MDALIAARAVQGLGGALVMPLTLTILSDAFPAARRGVALGIWGAVGGIAIASGPLVGGAVIEGHLVAVGLLAQRPRGHRARPARDHAAA